MRLLAAFCKMPILTDALQTPVSAHLARETAGEMPLVCPLAVFSCRWDMSVYSVFKTCLDVHRASSEPFLTSGKICQVAHNRPVPGLQCCSVLRHKKYSCKGPFLPCDGTSLYVWTTVKRIQWCEQPGRSHTWTPEGPNPHANHVLRLQYYTQTAAETGLENLSFALRTTGSFYSFHGAASRAQILLLYFCWQLRAFDLYEKHVLSRRKFMCRLASSLTHKGSVLC